MAAQYLDDNLSDQHPGFFKMEKFFFWTDYKVL